MAFVMSEHVILVRGGLGKTLPTKLTLKRLFIGVDPLMRGNVARLSECFGAETALEWFLTSVDTHVNLKKTHFK